MVKKEKASEGLLENGGDRMEHLIQFRDTLIDFRTPENGYRDMRRMNGADGPGPLKLEARKELLTRLLKLQEEPSFSLVSEEELLLIQKFWQSARTLDDGNGVARIVRKQKGLPMNTDFKELNRLRDLQEKVARQKNISVEALRRMLSCSS